MSSYKNMTDKTGVSGFLPTVIFAGTGSLTSAMRTTQLAAEGITGFYEADFADGITSIANNCFQNDTKVVVVTINKVTSIGQYAFDGCSHLRSITLHTETNSSTGIYLLTSIGDYAFQYCTSLREIYLPDSITSVSIGNYWFRGCTSLEVCVIGSGFTSYSINVSMCEGCTSLKYFVIPENITEVGNNAFKNCTSLATVVFNGKPIIKSNTFEGAKGSGAKYVYDKTWSSTYVGYLPAGITAATYTSVTLTPTANNTLTTSDVLTQYNGAKTNGTYLYKAVIASGTTTIGDYAFRPHELAAVPGATDPHSPCQQLAVISIPTSVTTIGMAAFSSWYGMSGSTSQFTSCGLYSIYFPRSITTINLEASLESQLFNLGNDTARAASPMLQIVFPSGSNIGGKRGTTNYPNNFGEKPFYFSPAKAIILPPNLGVINNNFMTECAYLQLCNLFQKNAKTSNDLIAIGYDGYFGAGYTIADKYVYVPKTIKSLGNRALANIHNAGKPTGTRLYMYSHVDGTQRDTSNNLWNDYIKNNTNAANMLANSGVWNIIANYYPNDGVGLTGQPANNGCHLLHVKQVTKLSSYAYQNCTQYSTMAFDHYGGPNLILSHNVFMNTDIVNIYFNERLLDMSTATFQQCRHLTSMSIPDCLTKIPDYAFDTCHRLTNLTIGANSSIKTIGQRAFAQCVRLPNIHIPTSLISIGHAAFTSDFNDFNVAGLVEKTITFGGGSRLSSLRSYAFGGDGGYYGWVRCKKMILPNNLSWMGVNIYRNHRGKFDIFIVPSNVDYIPGGFMYQEGWPYSSNQKLYLPVSINADAGPRKREYLVDNGMGDYCFPTTDVQSVAYMPSHMSSLFNRTGERFNHTYFDTANAKDYTASYYKTETVSSGSSITLDSSVANVTNDSTTTQRHIDFSDNPSTISGYSSGNKLNLISVNIPRSATTIGNSAFSGCSELVYVTFSEGSKLTTIEAYAFNACSMIHEITLPSSLTTIGNNAFSNCERMERIEIPYNVTSIGTSVFSGCTNLKHVTVYRSEFATTSYFPSEPTFLVASTLTLTNTLHPTSLTISQINNMYIYKRQTQLGIPTITFTANGQLTQSTVNTTLANNSVITNDVFHVEFSSGVTSIGDNAFKDIPNVFSVAISANITSIGSNAFYSVNSVLYYLSFHPDSRCTGIGANAFQHNKLFDLVLPDSLTSMNGYSFSNSYNLVSVCIPPNLAVMSGAFTACPNLTSVKVPSSWSSATNGSYFSKTGTTALNPLPTVYTTPSVPHFKLTDYSMPIGIVQNIFDSQLTYIDHLAYAYYTDISVYAEPRNQMRFAGPITYQINGTKMPAMPAGFIRGYNAELPIYRSIPNYFLLTTYLSFTEVSDNSKTYIANADDSYLVLPGYSITAYTNFYEEGNIFAREGETPSSYQSVINHFDNEYGKKPAQIEANPIDNGESALVMHSGKMVTKIYI